MRYFQLMLVAAVVAAPVAIAPTAVAAADETATPQRKERQICRRQGETGTRLKAPRICMTQAEWDRVQDDARSDVTSSNNRPHVISNGMNGRQSCPPSLPVC